MPELADILLKRRPRFYTLSEARLRVNPVFDGYDYHIAQYEERTFIEGHRDCVLAEGAELPIHERLLL